MPLGDSLLSLHFFPQRRENEGRSGIVGPPSSLGPSTADCQEPLIPDKVGNEVVETERFEDDRTLDQLQPPPQFGKDAQVLYVTRLNDIPGEFSIDFEVVDTDFDNISLWLKAPESVHLDFSQARCISLVCYRNSIQVIEGESCKHDFEILRPVPWTKIPPVISFSMNDAVTHLFPYEVAEYIFDISQYVRHGKNKLYISQVDSMSEYELVLYSHYPMESQIVPLRARWDERKRFMEQLAWLVRPI